MAGASALCAPQNALADSSTLPPLVLIATHAGGAGRVEHAPSGFFVGADSGWSTMLASGHDDATGAWSFGARAGWQLASGLAVQARFDDLGVTAPGSDAPLLFTTSGLRYSVPFVMMPFAEAMVGPAFDGSKTTVGTGVGLGVSMPILRHLVIDASARDWIASLDGSVRHVPTFQVGLSVGFAGRGH